MHELEDPSLTALASIPTRRELVKEAARNPTASEIKESRNEQQGHLWNFDPISQEPLAQPVVSDYQGRLFNKDSIIEFLLPSEEVDASRKVELAELLQGAITSLKDVVEVKLELEEALAAKSTRGANGRSERWVCPVTRQELGPGSKAVYIVPCGHAFSGSAVKEVSGEQCLQCNQSYASNDIIPILPVNEEDIARLSLRSRTLKENGLTHSLKKAGGGKKRKKAAGADAVANQEADSSKDEKKSTPQLPPLDKAAESIKNSSTASLTAKVLQQQDERNKRRKMENNKNFDSLFARQTTSKEKDIGFMNRGYAIPGRR